VRKGSSVSKGIIFYLLIGMFLIALVEKLVPLYSVNSRSVQYADNYLKSSMASAFPLEQLLLIYWQIKNDTLTGILVLWVLKMALP
jgi:hypothetical protein